MSDLEPVTLDSELKCNKEPKTPNWKPPDCDCASTNECCPSLDPSTAFPEDAPAAEDGAEVDGADADEEEDFKLETFPFDPRFPSTNQTKHCYVSFLEHKRCIKARGEDYTPCEYFKRAYTSMCPEAWVEKWEEQIEKGTFPGRL